MVLRGTGEEGERKHTSTEQHILEYLGTDQQICLNRYIRHTVLALEALCIPDSLAQNTRKPRLLPSRLIGSRPSVAAELQQRCWWFEREKREKATAGRPLSPLIVLHRLKSALTVDVWGLVCLIIHPFIFAVYDPARCLLAFCSC